MVGEVSVVECMSEGGNKERKKTGSLVDIPVELQDMQLVHPHNSREELHDKHLVLQRILLVCSEQNSD